MEQRSTVAVRISLSSYLRVLLAAFIILLVVALRDILGLLFLSMILAAGISPWIRWLAQHRIPRPLGLVIVYLTLIGVIVAVVALLIPAVTRETASISSRFPVYYDRVTAFFNRTPSAGSSALSAASGNLGALTRGVFAGLQGFARGSASFLLVLVMTFYFTMDERHLLRFWLRLAPARARGRIERIAVDAAERIGNWFKGQLLISAALASITFLLLTLTGVPNALLLGLVAGIASFVPFIGAIIGILPAVFVALTVSVTKAIIVLAVSFTLYQIVANVFVPKFFSRVVGLTPVVIVLVMLIGAKLSGAVGLILAVPIAAITGAVVREVGATRSNESHA